MMTSTDDRIDALITRIKNRRSLTDFIFIPAYPPHKTPNPITKYTVAVENREVSNKRFFIGNRVGRREKGYLEQAELRLRVYAPSRTSGSALLRASSMVMDAAEREDHEGWIRSFLLTGIGFDTASRTEYRDVVLKLAIVTQEEAEA